MNSLLRLKGGNLKPYVFQSFKRYIKPNCHPYSGLKYNYNAGRYASLLACNPAARSTTAVINAIHGDEYQIDAYRRFHTSRQLFETSSSKVDATVKKLKSKQKEKIEEIMKEVVNGTTADGNVTNGAETNPKDTTKAAAPAPATEKAVVKKPLKTRIWEEVLHYYHGFRLLFIDVKISSKLLWRVLNGKTLTRRENKLLLRTTSDLFRLIPFSVFVIVPFMELLLPVFIKFFPGMLPSTFQTAKEREDKLRQSLGVRLEMAKFLQQTLDEMPVQHRDHKSDEAKEFDEFFQKIKTPTAFVSNEDIIKFAKRFDDEITLDSLTREQLGALCRVLELNTIGTTTLLRFQLRLKLRSLVTDDRVIAREGVDSLDLFELQQACKSRGMRAYGLTAERLRFQLKEWIDLSLNEKVAPTLLLLSRAMLISDDSITTDKLKETIRVLPDSVAAQTKHAIGEREGKIDPKTKIEIIREEERRIKEEREEEREERKAKLSEETLTDDVPFISSEQLKVSNAMLGSRDQLKDMSGDCVKDHPEEPTISSSDVQLLTDALKTLSSDKKLVVEKETIKELKEELADYKDDVEELREVRQVVKEPVHESRAAKLLYKRVNSMIEHLDKVLNDLEQKQEKIRHTDAVDLVSTKRSDLVHIDELVQTVKNMKEASDETRFKIVEDLLVKLDNDKDGAITINEVMKVVKSMDSTHHIDKKYLDEFITLLTKQAQKRQQQEIVRIDDLMMSIKKLKETSDEARLTQIGTVLDKFDADKDGVITVNEIMKVLESIGRDNIKLDEKQVEELIALFDKEQILQAEEKIEKAIAKSMKEAEKLKTEVEKSDSAVNKLVENINDSAEEIKDIAKELGAIDKSMELKDIAREMQDKAKGLKPEADMKDIAKDLHDGAGKKSGPNAKDTPKSAASSSIPPTISSSIGGGTSSAEAILREATERQVEKIIPQVIPEVTPTTMTPPTSSTTTPLPPTTSTPPKSSAASAASAGSVAAVNGNSKKLI